MSLRVNNGRSRGRSKSPGRRDERSRSRDVRAPSPAVVVETKKTVKKYYSDESDSDARSRRKSSKKHYDESESDSDPRSKRKPPKKRHESDESDSDPKYRKMSSKKRYESDDSDSDPKYKKRTAKTRLEESDSDTKARNRSSRKYYEDSGSSSSSSEDDKKRKHKNSKSKHEDADRKHHRARSPDAHSMPLTRKGTHGESSRSKHAHERHGSYTEPDRHETRHGSYAEPDHHERRTEYKRHLSNSSMEGGEKYRQLSMPGGFNGGHSPNPQYAQPQAHRPENQRVHSGPISSGIPEYANAENYQYSNLGVYDANGRNLSYTQTAHPQFVHAKPHGGLHAPPSPPHLHRLSVSGGAAGVMSLAAPGQHVHMQGGAPPGSPLLEAYHGTYQSISPMPSPLMLPSNVDDGLSDIEPLDGEESSDGSRGHLSENTGLRKKTVSFYDPEPDARALAAALKHSTPDSRPIIKILPHLSDDHILMLRTEYKKHMKAQGKGVNIAKHIKMKIIGNLGKVAYATALGKWESEAHWANFWYQSNTSRRELLIESLMGRTNSEIVKIKDAFSDQRYNNSLEKCMETELKKDKFRNAVLLALEERRMSENAKLSIDMVRKDAQDLYRALTAKEGGETAMINIIVVRSDKHLGEVLRVFENQYHKNFAREMIQKSRNLVGETLAHILNGVLNRPVRDALLLHQALAETSKDRIELLVSRLVRFHWEPPHLERVKAAYKHKYKERLESAIDEGTKGEFRDFCVGLCRVES